MTRAERVGTLALGGAIIAEWLVWWVPSLALMAARLAVSHLRFRGEMVAVDALFGLGRDAAARCVLARVIRRNRRKLRAARQRMRP